MTSRKGTVRYLVEAGLIAALYAVLCLVLQPIAYGSLQFRPAEAMTLLPLILPASVPGLTIGCAIANFWSPYGLIDICFGALATLLAACVTRMIGKKLSFRKAVWLAPLPPTLFNALIVGGVLTFMTAEEGARLPAFGVFAFEVGICELAVCAILGIPLVLAMKRFYHPVSR